MHVLLMFLFIYFLIGFFICLIDYLFMNNIILSIVFLWPLWILGFLGLIMEDEDLDGNDEDS